MKKYFSLTAFILCLHSLTLYAQDTLRLDFKPEPENHFNAEYPGMKLTKLGGFKGIPEAMDSCIYLFNFQRRQSTYTNYLKGYYTDEEFQKILTAYKIDTLGLYSKSDISNSLVVFSALLPGNRKLIIPDVNFNNDFGDDKVYEYRITDFDAKAPIDSIETLHLTYNYYHQGQLHKRQLSMKLLPTSRGFNPAKAEDKPLMVSAAFNQLKSALINIGGVEYKLSVDFPVDLAADYSEVRAIYTIDVANNKRGRYNPALKVGEFFSLGNKQVKIEKISYFGDTGYLIVK
jgi:hypothetical protein